MAIDKIKDTGTVEPSPCLLESTEVIFILIYLIDSRYLDKTIDFLSIAVYNHSGNESAIIGFPMAGEKRYELSPPCIRTIITYTNAFALPH